MNATPISEIEARALTDAIEQVSTGQMPETALKFVEMAVTRAPQQPLVLNAAGGYMYRSGNAPRARQLFESAVAVDGNSKVLWLNLANTCRALGDKKSEAQALEKALAIDPRYVLALLCKGQLMEGLGERKKAFFFYEAALDSVASGAPAPQHAAAALTHAQEVVLARKDVPQDLCGAGPAAPMRHSSLCARRLLLHAHAAYQASPTYWNDQHEIDRPLASRDSRGLRLSGRRGCAYLGKGQGVGVRRQHRT